MSISIQDKLEIPGLQFRAFRGETDYPAIVAINNASWPVDDRLDVDTLEDCRASFASIPNLDPTRDAIVTEVFGEPIAYAIVTYASAANEQGVTEFWFDVEATVQPQWRRRKIGLALQAWLESRVDALRLVLAPIGPAHVTSTTRDKNVGRAALLRQLGFIPTRFWFGMEHSLELEKEEHPLPSELTIRPVSVKDFRKILMAQKHALREKPEAQADVTEEELSDFTHFATDQMKQYELWQVAWHGDEVVGMVLNNIDLRGNQQLGLNRGFTDPICIVHQWRRQGVAKALISRSLNILRKAGVATAFLGVDTQNPNHALRLYEAMGFAKVKSGTTYQKDI